jgi:hypothetical protein
MIGRVGDVELEYVGVNAGSAKLLGCLLSLFQVAGSDDDLDAVVLEVKSRLKSKSAIAAGNECDFLSHD